MARQSTRTSPDQSQPIAAAAPGRRNRRAFLWETGLVGAILLLALLLRLWHLNALTDNYDEGVYWSSLRAMYAGNGLFTPVFSSQPPFFLLSLYPLVAVFGPGQLAARLGVVMLSLIGILGMYLLARRLGGAWAGAGAALLLVCDYIALIQSQTIEAEAPSVALMIVAVAAAAYADRYPWQGAAISGAATALALLEKLFAVAAIVPILMLFLGYVIAFERVQPAVQVSELGASFLARLRTASSANTAPRPAAGRRVPDRAGAGGADRLPPLSWPASERLSAGHRVPSGRRPKLCQHAQPESPDAAERHHRVSAGAARAAWRGGRPSA